MKALTKDTAIALLMGGPGSEREVSLVSGNAVLEALKNEGFTNVTPVIVDSVRPAIPEGTELCYNMIHGTYGEDGGLQSYLEELGIPYTGAGSVTSRNCFDKILTKKAFFAAGVPTPADEIIRSGQMPTIGVPCVIKPPCEGSSVGVSIVKTEEELPAAVAEAAKIFAVPLVKVTKLPHVPPTGRMRTRSVTLLRPSTAAHLATARTFRYAPPL